MNFFDVAGKAAKDSAEAELSVSSEQHSAVTLVSTSQRTKRLLFSLRLHIDCTL
jgi:hypothetical protein